MKNKEMLDCFDCRFFDGFQMVCMHDCKVKAIFDTEETALNYSNFKMGNYDLNELEKLNYK